MKKLLIGLLIFAITFTTASMPVYAKTNSKTNDTYLSEEIQDYCHTIGHKYNICPELLMAIIEAESSGNPYAVNYDGSCIGLMQVSEYWHSDRMKRLGVYNLYDAYGNILVGTDYLCELIVRYEDIAIALMYYNGDSNAEAFENGKCEISYYAESILERSAKLEALHNNENDNENENIKLRYEMTPHSIRNLKFALC